MASTDETRTNVINVNLRNVIDSDEFRDACMEDSKAWFDSLEAEGYDWTNPVFAMTGANPQPSQLTPVHVTVTVTPKPDVVKGVVVISFDVPRDADPNAMAEENIDLLALLWGNRPNAEVLAATAEDAEAVLAAFKEDKQHDEGTLRKVHEAIRTTDLHGGTRMTNEEATWIIGSLQNAGILFRERL